jgi:DNA-binding MarR family transcriptional regulator
MTTTSKVEVVTQLPFLTDRQMSLLQFLHSYFQDHRYMPTRREIASFLELKSDNATPYLSALEKKGYLKRSGERVRRNLELTETAYEKLELESENDSVNEMKLKR